MLKNFSTVNAKSMFSINVITLFVGMLLFLGSENLQAQNLKLTVQQVENIESIVKNYLLKNPIVIREAIVNLQKQDAQAAADKAKEAVLTYRKELLDAPMSPVVGNPKADVTIVEFFDFQCGYCKKVASVLNEIMKTDPNVRIVFKQFPVLGPNSILAAKVALAVHKQGKYEEFHNTLLATESLDENTVYGIVDKLGLNVSQIRQDIESESIQAEIESNYQMSSPLGITGTPGFVIGNKIAPGALDVNAMRQMIASARQKM
jgi:protein-disulfide isomerase